MDDILERSPRDFDELIRYGNSPQQFVELRWPRGQGPSPMLFMIHGGFWQNKYDLSHVSHFCAALTSKGIVTCSIEYRRLGDPEGGWPGTFLDVSRATNHVLDTVSVDPRIDCGRIGVVGHSAGGHLALWLVSRQNIPKGSPLVMHGKNRLSTAMSLAGVSDLREASKERLGNGAVARLMGGSPEQFPDRYASGSPIELLPSGSRVVLVHGSSDGIVPISQSEKYFERAQAHGDHSKLVRLEGVGHFELIDPESSAWARVEQAVLSMLEE